MEPLPRNRAMIPYEGPTTLGDLVLKMEKLRQLADAIARAKQTMIERKTYFYAQAYVSLVKEREELRKTLPPLRLVSGD